MAAYLTRRRESIKRARTEGDAVPERWHAARLRRSSLPRTGNFHGRAVLVRRAAGMANSTARLTCSVPTDGVFIPLDGATTTSVLPLLALLLFSSNMALVAPALRFVAAQQQQTVASASRLGCCNTVFSSILKNCGRPLPLRAGARCAALYFGASVQHLSIMKRCAAAAERTCRAGGAGMKSSTRAGGKQVDMTCGQIAYLLLLKAVSGVFSQLLYCSTTPNKSSITKHSPGETDNLI